MSCREHLAVVRIEAAGDKSGEIHFQKGQVCHAVTGAMTGDGGIGGNRRTGRTRGLSETELPVDSPGRSTRHGRW